MPCDPFTLKIIFHGLLAFVVPMKDQAHKVPEVYALMVDATDIRTVPTPFLDINRCQKSCTCGAVNKDDLLHRHRAAVRYRSKNVDPDGDESLLLWLLDGYDLQLDFSGNTGPVELASGRLPNSERPALNDPGQVADFSWVPEVSKVSRRLGKVHPDVISPAPDEELSERLAARVKLRGGRLSTGEVSIEKDEMGVTRAQLFEFKPKVHGGLRQALAETVVYNTTVAGCDVKLRGTKFGDNANVESITFKPKKDEHEVVLEFVNVRDEFLLVHHYEQDALGSLGGENFLWFYKLSANNLGPFPIPATPGGMITGKPYCPMASFEP